MANNRDFIARSQAMAEKMHGRTATVEEMATNCQARPSAGQYRSTGSVPKSGAISR